MGQIHNRQWAPRHISAPISQIYGSSFELSPLRRLAALLHRRIQPQTKSYSPSSKREFRASSLSFARAACDLERNARTEPPRKSRSSIACAGTLQQTAQRSRAPGAGCSRQARSSRALAADVLTTEREIHTLTTNHITILSTECFNSLEFIQINYNLKNERKM